MDECIEKDLAAIAKIICYVIFVSIGIIIGYRIASYRLVDYYQREAVERNYAEYNPITGNWQWKDKPHTTPNIESN